MSGRINQSRRLTRDDIFPRLQDALLVFRKPLPTTPEGQSDLNSDIKQALALIREISIEARRYSLTPDDKPAVVELIQHLEGLQAPPFNCLPPNALAGFEWLKV
jgi:hypothetical protein